MSRKLDDFKLCFRLNLIDYCLLGRSEGDAFMIKFTVPPGEEVKVQIGKHNQSSGSPQQYTDIMETIIEYSVIIREKIKDASYKKQKLSLVETINFLTAPIIYEQLEIYAGVDYATGTVWLNEDWGVKFKCLQKIGRIKTTELLLKTNRVVTHKSMDVDSRYSIYKLCKNIGIPMEVLNITNKPAEEGGIIGEVNVDIKPPKNMMYTDYDSNTIFIDHHILDKAFNEDIHYRNSLEVMHHMGFEVEEDAIEVIDQKTKAPFGTITWGNLLSYMDNEEIEAIFSESGKVFKEATKEEVRTMGYITQYNYLEQNNKDAKKFIESKAVTIPTHYKGDAMFVQGMVNRASAAAFELYGVSYYISVTPYKGKSNKSTFAIICNRSSDVEIPIEVQRKVKELFPNTVKVSPTLMLVGGRKNPNAYVKKTPYDTIEALKKIFSD